MFKKAIDNVKPSLEVKSRRVGWLELPGAGRSEPEPASVAQHPLAGLWLHAARACDASRGEAGQRIPRMRRTSAAAAVKKREDTHRMAEANKAFAHYRW